jgi:hypothetical protein
MAAAYREAGRRQQQQGKALERLAQAVDQIEAEEGFTSHPGMPIGEIIRLAAERRDPRAIALREAVIEAGWLQ